MSVMTDPYVVEFRVHHPESGRVEFVRMPGRNAGHCFNLTASKFAGWVVTRADDVVALGTPGEHFWNVDETVCVKCGGLEHMVSAFDECSGIYGL